MGSGNRAAMVPAPLTLPVSTREARFLTGGRRVVRAATAGLAIVAAALLAGCGSQIDTAKAQSEIQKGIERQTAGRIAVRAVDCPEGIDLKQGARFTCSVVGADGRRGRVTVVQTDGEGTVSYTGDLRALLRG